MHKGKLVHRDIKPSNIMVSLGEGGCVTVKIIDLGLAKSLDEQGSQTAISMPRGFAGTPEFASPEQFAGVGVDIRSDLYSLGVVLWEMLTGHPPFRGTPAELIYLHQHGVLPLERLKRFPQRLMAILEALLDKDPKRRFQTPAELLKALSTTTSELESPGSQKQEMAIPVPVDCYLILLSRIQGEPPSENFDFTQIREKLSQKVQASPESAGPLSNLAVVDALLGKKQMAFDEAKRSVEILMILQDAASSPAALKNLAVVYTWTGELDLAFETLSVLTKVPSGLYYGDLKLDPYWDPLRKDPRFEELLAELSPGD